MSTIRPMPLSRQISVQPRPLDSIPNPVEVLVSLVGMMTLFFSFMVMVFQLMEEPTTVFTVWSLLSVLAFLWFSQIIAAVVCLFIAQPIPTALFVFLSLLSCNCSAVWLTCLAFLRHPLVSLIGLLTLVSLFNSIVLFIIHRLPEHKKGELFSMIRPRSRVITLESV